MCELCAAWVCVCVRVRRPSDLILVFYSSLWYFTNRSVKHAAVSLQCKHQRVAGFNFPFVSKEHACTWDNNVPEFISYSTESCPRVLCCVRYRKNSKSLKVQNVWGHQSSRCTFLSLQGHMTSLLLARHDGRMSPNLQSRYRPLITCAR